MADENEQFAAEIWQQIEADDILPSEALPLIEQVRTRCLADLLQPDLDLIRLGKVVLMLGILASKIKRYQLAVHYLEMSVNFYSALLKIGQEWENLHIQDNPIDQIYIKGRLVTAHEYLGANMEEMGLLKEAVNHIEKGFDFTKDIPNPAISSVQGFCYFNLSIWAFKCLQLDRAIDLGDRSVRLFRELPAANNENRVQLGKAERLMALIYSIKGHDHKAEQWMERFQNTVSPLGAQIWFDILYMEVEVVLWKGLYAQGEERLDWLLSCDLDVSQRMQTLVWKLLLHHHQQDEQKLGECILAFEAIIQDHHYVTDEDIAKAMYEFSRVLFMHKNYTAALSHLDIEYSMFALDAEYALKGHIRLLKGEILMAMNSSEFEIMECFDQAEGFLKECFPKNHYVFAQLNQCIARARMKFGNASGALNSLKEARDIILTSFSRLSFTFIKLDFDFVEAYTRMGKFRSAVELLEEMVETMETGRIMPHEPFCHDSKWQCAELVSAPHDTHSQEAKDRLQELKNANPGI